MHKGISPTAFLGGLHPPGTDKHPRGCLSYPGKPTPCRGISPIVSVVLLIAIAVIAGVGLYFWAGGLVTKQPTTETPVTISAFPLDAGNGKILVVNTGESVLSGPLYTTDGTECSLEEDISPGEQGVVTCPPKRGEIVLYGPSVGSAHVFLNPQEVEDITSWWSDTTTANWSNPWNGTYTNTTNGSIRLDTKRWWDQQNISNASNTQHFTSIAVGPDNTVHLVWTSNEGGSYDMYYANSSTGWTKTPIGTTVSSWTRPDVAIDSNSVVHIVWDSNNDGDYDVYYANSSSGWSVVKVNNGANDQRIPSIAIDNNRIVHLTWYGNNDGDNDIYYANSSSNWTEVTISNFAVDQTMPSIAVDSNNVVHIVWDDERDGFPDQDIYYANSSSGWTETRINNSPKSQAAPVIVVDSNDILHICWYDYRAGNWDIYYANSSSGWAEQVVSNAALLQTYPDITVDKHNVAHIVWQGNNDGDYDIYYANSSSGWLETVINNGTNNQYQVSITSDLNNVIHVAWDGDNDGDYDIYYTNSTEDYFLTGTFLSNVKDTGFTPAYFTRVVWDSLTPVGTTLGLKLYFSNFTNFSVNKSITPSNGQTHLDDSNRYVRCWLNLTTNNKEVSPSLTAFELDYQAVPGNLTYSVNLDDGIQWVALNRSDNVIVANDTVSNCNVFYSNTVTNSTSYSYEVIAKDCNGVIHRESYSG